MSKIAYSEISRGFIVSLLIYCLNKRDDGLFRLFTKYTCVTATYFMSVCASTYPMEHNLTSIMILNLEMSVSDHAQLSNMSPHTKTHLDVKHMKEISRALFYYYKSCY